MTRTATCLRAPVWVLAATLLFPAVAGANSATVEPIPLEHFFAEPDIRAVQLSPDGKHLAFLTTIGTGTVGVALMELATGKVEPLVGAKDDNIDFFLWKGNDTVVYAGDLGGNESGAWRSISLSKRRAVSLAESYRERYADRANFAALVDDMRFEPNHILISGNKAIGDVTYGLWKLDVRNGRRTAVEIYELRESLVGLIPDNNGRVLARSRFLGDKLIYEVRAETGVPYTKVAEFPANDDQWRIFRFGADNETLYISSTEDTDTDKLFTLNVRTRQRSETLFHHPGGNIDNLILSYDRTKLCGVSYITDKTHYRWFDPAWEQLKQQIDASLPETQNEITSRSADESLLIILATGDRHPGTYYLLDRKRGRLMPIGKQNRYLVPEKLAAMEPITFKARDGLTIHGYLTRPPNHGNAPTPLIVNPHGGPFGIRDQWGYNAEVQFLANRGYAVLQINYRGSGGYGESFLKAGRREWGRKMQDDLTDGVQWAIDQRIADPNRIAIYGASYGGYAALVGVTFTPDLYRCAVNYVGVSDLNLLRRWGWMGGRGDEDYLEQWIGTEKEYLAERSPVNFVERIKVPTLHAYGFNDPRVDIEHWKRLEPRLKQFNKPYEIIIEDREGHGFSNESARITFYKRLEAFLAKHL